MRRAWALLTMLALLPSLTLAAETKPSDVLGPPWFQESLVYYNAFDAPPINAGQLETPAVPAEGVPGGLFGRGLPTQTAPLTLHGPALSPHRPLTLSFWWALPADLPLDGGFTLFALTGRGHISAFCRGKGDWCGLQRPAGVAQVYDMAGLQNVNDIYDFDLQKSLDLHAHVWHHTAVVFRRASSVQVYTDGNLETEITTSARDWTPGDGLTTLQLGGGVLLDEIAVLDRALDAASIADYYKGVSQLRREDAPH